MIKRLLALLLTFSAILTVCACGEKEITKKDVLALFDEDEYTVDVYENARLDEIYPNLGINGELRAVTHVIKKGTKSPDLIWVYLYEFSLEAEAVSAETAKKTLAEKFENGKCLRFDKLVVYGNSPLLAKLEK